MQVVLLLAISVCVASIVDFGYNAYQRTILFSIWSDSFGDPPLGGSIEKNTGLHMQLDAAVALLASAAILGLSVALSKLSRRGKRLVFGAEAVVLAVMIVISILVRIN
jgi:hypothetical protein